MGERRTSGGGRHAQKAITIIVANKMANIYLLISAVRNIAWKGLKAERRDGHRAIERAAMLGFSEWLPSERHFFVAPPEARLEKTLLSGTPGAMTKAFACVRRS